jgi:hypothetical protein
MNKIDFTKKAMWSVKQNLLAASGDPFMANRELYGCQFFNNDIQKALRSWLEEESLSIWKMPSDEFDRKFHTFTKKNESLGAPFQKFIRWLERDAELADGDSNTSLYHWRVVFGGLNARTDLHPVGGLPQALKNAVGMYRVLTGDPLDAIYPVLMSLRKQWDPYVTEEEKAHNLSIKGEWDRELYLYAGLRDELELFDRHGCAPANYFFHDFIDDYVKRFDAEERQQIQADIIAILSNTDYDYDSQRLIFPLETLQEPETT